jgi:hypothetical protein
LEGHNIGNLQNNTPTSISTFASISMLTNIDADAQGVEIAHKFKDDDGAIHKGD